MYGRRKPRLKQQGLTTDDAKHLTAQQKYIDTLIENVRQYFIKLDKEHKELTTLQAYLLAKKLQSEQGKKSGVPVVTNNEESEVVNSIRLELSSKFVNSEEVEEEDSE